MLQFSIWEARSPGLSFSIHLYVSGISSSPFCPCEFSSLIHRGCLMRPQAIYWGKLNTWSGVRQRKDHLCHKHRGRCTGAFQATWSPDDFIRRQPNRLKATEVGIFPVEFYLLLILSFFYMPQSFPLQWKWLLCQFLMEICNLFSIL